MTRKERQFAKSQEWLAWLSDSPTTAPTAKRQLPMHPDKTQGQHRSSPQASQERSEHRLGLKADMFTAQTPSPAQRPPMALKRGLRASQASHSNQRHTQPAVNAEDTIAIHIDLPKIRLPKITIPWAKILRWGVPILLAGVLIVATPMFLHNRSEKAKEKAVAANNTKELSYAPLKPSDKPNATLGAKYDSKHQVYSYTDKYLGRNLIISQQPLPDEIRADPTKLIKAAEALGAKDKFTTTSGTVYIATFEDQGVQQMILIHRQLLVYITSKGGTLNNSQWVTYIQSLQ